MFSLLLKYTGKQTLHVCLLCYHSDWLKKNAVSSQHNAEERLFRPEKGSKYSAGVST